MAKCLALLRGWKRFHITWVGIAIIIAIGLAGFLLLPQYKIAGIVCLVIAGIPVLILAICILGVLAEVLPIILMAAADLTIVCLIGYKAFALIFG